MGEWENERTEEQGVQGKGRTGERKNGETEERGNARRGNGRKGNGRTGKRGNGETEKRRNGETEKRRNGGAGERENGGTGGHQLPLTEYQGKLKKVYCYWVLSGNQVKFWCDNINPPTSPYPLQWWITMQIEVARANGTRHDVGSSKELEIMINEILAFVNYL